MRIRGQPDGCALGSGSLTSNLSSSGGPESFWLPWHIDSQFITLLTSDDFYNEVRVRVRVSARVRVEGLGLRVRVEVRVRVELGVRSRVSSSRC